MTTFEMIAAAVLLAVCGFVLRELREFKKDMADETRALTKALGEMAVNATKLGGLIESLSKEVGLRADNAEREAERFEQNDKELFERIRAVENTVRVPAGKQARKQ